MKCGHTHRGMTLIEVLVALVVIAVALSAIIETVNSGVVSVTYMKERTMAQWVADNQDTRLQLSANVIGTQWSEEKMAGRDWQVRTRIETTNDPGILRAYIDVFTSRDASEPSAQLVSYIGKTS